jgi:hypothetical protein
VAGADEGGQVIETVHAALKPEANYRWPPPAMAAPPLTL